jgi:chaperonin cofactor prefoldin
MEDRYIIECICINKDNDFGINVGDVFYYNKKAQTLRYLTKKWSKISYWDRDVCHPEEEDNKNPYLDDYWSYCAPFTPKMNNAKIYKRLAETKKVCEEIEKIGDFSCKILVLITMIKELEYENIEDS